MENKCPDVIVVGFGDTEDSLGCTTRYFQPDFASYAKGFFRPRYMFAGGFILGNLVDRGKTRIYGERYRPETLRIDDISVYDVMHIDDGGACVVDAMFLTYEEAVDFVCSEYGVRRDTMKIWEMYAFDY